jgi:putative oxidoreductase
MGLARLALRGTVGTLFVGHGMQKLNGSFGGEGIEATGQMFDKIGMRPGKRHALAAGAAETVGGALLVAGLFTPAAVAMLSGVMITAIRTVHLRNGVWVTKGGYEYNLVLLASLYAIADVGPGTISLDALRGKNRAGAHWALAAVGFGALGSWLATEYANRYQEPSEHNPERWEPPADETSEARFADEDSSAHAPSGTLV